MRYARNAPEKINLVDPSLFGNDAGEDEDPDILASYFVEKPSFKSFMNAATRLGIVRARKGMGKSALLKMLGHEREKTARKNDIVISLRGNELSVYGFAQTTDPTELINYWQQAILSRISMALATQCGMTPAQIKDVCKIDASEIINFRGRSVIHTILLYLDRKVPSQGRIVERLREVSASTEKPLVWVLVDDIDSTFIDSPPIHLRTSTFFTACRQIVSDIPGILLRASVRTDVWTAIKRTDESLDKCEQYIIDISWSQEDHRQILVRKILSYLKRNNPTFFNNINAEEWRNILHLVFSSRFQWGESMVTADRPIHILSAGRPRWSAQLCRLAGNNAVTNRHTIIGNSDIHQVMKSFGKARLDDLYREHGHQFRGLQELVECFAGGSSKYATEDLQDLISNKYLRQILKTGSLPVLEGIRPANPLPFCAFLYKIGFLFARVDGKGVTGGTRFVRYEDRPELLRTITNLDDGLTWEVYPSYRNVLGISKAKSRSGREESVNFE